MRFRFLTDKRLGRTDYVLLAAIAVTGSASFARAQALSLPTFGLTVYNVTVANSAINGDAPASTASGDNSTALNAYISYCSSHGGGTVEIPAGTFDSNTITMASNVNLQLDAGAVLFDATPANTLIQTPSSSTSNMEISGSGIINGGATTMVGSNKLVSLSKVTTLEITGVSVENATQEHLAVENDSNVTINNVTIADPGTLAANSNSYLANTDGIDFGGSNFTIENCNINDGDDDIVAKSASTACSNILITNNAIGAGHGISVGGGTALGLKNMTVSNITFSGTTDGLRVKAQDASGSGTSPGGGTANPLVNVLYSNIVMNDVADPIIVDSFYGLNSSNGKTGQNNFPTSPTQTNYAADSTTPMWENIGFNNVTITGSPNAGVIYDLNTTPSNLTGLSFNNVNINATSGMNLWWGSNINLSGLTVNQAIDEEDLTNVTPVGTANITWNNTGASVAGTSLGDGTTWDITANQNWNTGSSFTAYTNSSNVTFNDSNSGHYNVTLNTTVSPVSTTINNTTNAYTISGTGTIAGSGSLTKTGANTATISTANAYTGGTIINGGTLALGSVDALGAAGTAGTGTGAKPGGTTVNTNGSLDLNGLSISEPITLNGGTLTNSNAATASVIGGVKGIGYTTTKAGIGAGSTINFSSGTAAATPIFGITAASFSGFSGTYITTAVTLTVTDPPPTAPNVTITPSDGNGSGALAIAVLSGTTSPFTLSGITVIYPGSGYDAAPIITFTGGNPTVAGAATGNASNFTLVGIQTTSAGSGYTSAPTAILTNNSGSGTVSLTPVIGSITLESTSSVGGNAGNINLPLPITGTGGLIKTGSDTVTISAVALYAGSNTEINQGTLAIGLSGLITSSPLDVNTNGTLNFIAQTAGTAPLARTVAGINLKGGNAVVALAPSPQKSNRSVLITPSLNITSGTLDLTNNDMILSSGGSSELATVTQEITQGRNGGAVVWSGSAGGITSSAAAATPTVTALGAILNDNGAGTNTPLMTLFDGRQVGDKDVLVKYTFVGDTNLDGVVNASDYINIDNAFSFNSSPANAGNLKTGWINGDFNYDGVVNGDDYTLIDNAFNSQGSTSFAAASAGQVGPTEMIAAATAQIAQVPEPSISLIGLAAFAFMGRRSRRTA
jgi:autotransporter-associated beta strand protein